MTERIYNDPINGAESSVGPQLRTDKYEKKALIEAAKMAVFGPMSGTKDMPRNMGKKIISYHYVPILDDANINDQGIDAAGVSTGMKATYRYYAPGTTIPAVDYNSNNVAVGEGVDATAAQAAAKVVAQSVLTRLGVWTTDYATTRAAMIADGWIIKDDSSTPAVIAVPATGNLYGSSKDIGTIVGKMPNLTEQGGRVNRVGNTRVTVEGTLAKFGIFEEYTTESVDFDTDADLQMHIHRELINAANELTEDAIQVDLLTNPGVIRFGGEATATAEITGENGATPSLVTYEDLMRLEITLDNNRCPKNTKLISGSRMQDTRTVQGARALYIGSELIPMVRKMVDLFGKEAFISIEKYAAAGTLLPGEIGSIGGFRIIVAQEMQHWAGAGATVATNDGYRETGGKYDVFPMLVVGSEAFTTIGFQTSGGKSKFSIKHAAPGSEISYSANDPYGEKGFMSIKWYYGSIVQRPERIAVVKCVAEY